MHSSNKAKEAAGKAAAQLVHPGMLVGLGTGSTAAYFIEFLGERCRKGLDIHALPSSQQSENLAKKVGIPLLDSETVIYLDLTVDGADEIDDEKRAIKGAGGALLREKIIASMSRSFIVIVDSSKYVDHVGHNIFPLEIIPFAFRATIHAISQLGYQGKLRMVDKNRPYITDNQHFVYDIQLPQPLTLAIETIDHTLRSVPGVVDTGLFVNMVDKIIIGYEDGRIEIKE